MEETRLSRQEASDAVGDLGWRFTLGALRTAVAVRSLEQASEAASTAVAAAGPFADDHLWVDLRNDRMVLTVQTLATAWLTRADLDLARKITAALAGQGLTTAPDVGSGPRSVQLIEIAVDALDIASIRPFWRALLAYVDEPGADGPEDPIVDPLRQSPSIWFQQMDAPRPQRNRIHLDVCVPHDEAPARMAAALAAGGTLKYDKEAPAFWVLADAEGNEACITTWQGRD
jgi:4a-hydroxytetrahydrobiopterin dehydratase